MKRKAKLAKKYGQGQYREKFTDDNSPQACYNPFPSSIIILGESLQKKNFLYLSRLFDYAFIQVSCAPHLRTLMLLYKKELRLSKFMTQTSRP